MARITVKQVAQLLELDKAGRLNKDELQRFLDSAKADPPVVLGEITLGGEIYEILSVLKPNEDYIEGGEVVKWRSRWWKANGDEKTRDLLFAYTDSIPKEFDGMTYNFCDIDGPSRPDDPDEGIAVVYKIGNQCVHRWRPLDVNRYSNDVLLRHRPKRRRFRRCRG